MDWFIILQKAFLGGFAAIGFAILFNVPARSLVFIYFFGCTSIFFKFFLLANHVNIILATFTGACVIGVISQFASFLKKTPPMIFSIASVIPMIPGVFLYRMMLGFIQIVSIHNDIPFDESLYFTVSNGLKAFFTLMALAMGIGWPYILLKKETFHELKIPSRKTRRDEFK